MCHNSICSQNTQKLPSELFSGPVIAQDFQKNLLKFQASCMSILYRRPLARATVKVKVAPLKTPEPGCVPAPRLWAASRVPRVGGHNPSNIPNNPLSAPQAAFGSAFTGREILRPKVRSRSVECLLCFTTARVWQHLQHLRRLVYLHRRIHFTLYTVYIFVKSATLSDVIDACRSK